MLQCHIVPTFPGGKFKALTFSYDDGVHADERFIELLKKYNLKGTFNLNSAWYNGDFMPQRDVECYKNDLFEVACHTVSHPKIKFMPDASVAAELIEDRKNLEAIFGRIIKGYASPFGDSNERLAEITRIAGLNYCRTVKSTLSFDLPEDPIFFNPTCHHKEEKLFELADKFLNEVPHPHVNPWLFYVWGHTYEFDAVEGAWERIEEFMKKIANKGDVWYATNGEIIDYLRDFSRLEYSADALTVHNPTAKQIFFRSAIRNGEGNGEITDLLVCVNPGETVDLRKLI